MSSLVSDRLLVIFINVKRRLESLLNVCRISENPLWTNDDNCEEIYQFFGPYISDIEELEDSITRISSLIENLQHEQNTNDDCQPFSNYPLCKNGWTFKEIEQLDEEQDLNLRILNQLSLHTLTGQLDDQQCPNVNIIHF